MNKYSSRAHTIFQIFIETVVGGRHNKIKLNFCDLAGNEKFKNIGKFTKQHFAEMKSINQSLSTLGKVVNMLASGTNNIHLPYRESKLTRVLQDSLGGTSSSYLLATLSPNPKYIEESNLTLQFAQRTSKVKVHIKDELEDVKQGVKVVDHLKGEINYLKKMLQIKRSGNGISSYIFRIKQLEKENSKLKTSNFSIKEYKKLIQENRKIKMELDTLKTVRNSKIDLGETRNADLRSNADSISKNINIPQQQVPNDDTIEMILNPDRNNDTTLIIGGKKDQKNILIEDAFVDHEGKNLSNITSKRGSFSILRKQSENERLRSKYGSQNLVSNFQKKSTLAKKRNLFRVDSESHYKTNSPQKQRKIVPKGSDPLKLIKDRTYRNPSLANIKIDSPTKSRNTSNFGYKSQMNSPSYKSTSRFKAGSFKGGSSVKVLQQPVNNFNVRKSKISKFLVQEQRARKGVLEQGNKFQGKIDQKRARFSEEY